MTRDRRLATAILFNVVIVVVQVVFGVRARSLGLLADAGHNLTDVAALGLSLWALRLTRRSPTAKRSFGYHRSGILAAQANSALILVATALITYEGIRRLQHPQPVEGLLVVVVAAVGLLANGMSTMLLHDHSHDVNMRSAVLHLAGDAAASAGVVIAGLIIYLTNGSYWIDPAISLIIARVGRTRVRSAERARELLQFTGAKQIAVALTDTGKPSRRRYQYYRYAEYANALPSASLDEPRSRRPADPFESDAPVSASVPASVR